MSDPTFDELSEYLKETRNWGRWGADDQTGAINLITPEKLVYAASLVKSGRKVSLSRPLPKNPAPNNPNPAQHWIRTFWTPPGGASVDYIATSYHGYATTHLDALCHVWGGDGLYNGADPDTIRHGGARWGAVDRWSTGIATRGVLLDIPRYRGEPYVTLGKPVTGEELNDVATAQGVEIQPGDALVVCSGREQHDKAHAPWGAIGTAHPGLHPSCLKPIREHDVAILIWDMLDATMPDYPQLDVHSALWAFGVALVDNALLEPLAAACVEEGRYEFLIAVAPLLIAGGTGSPVNPIAIF